MDVKLMMMMMMSVSLSIFMSLSVSYIFQDGGQMTANNDQNFGHNPTYRISCEKGHHIDKLQRGTQVDNN